MMLRCPDVIRKAISGRRSDALTATRAGDDNAAWALLEEAHILSQPWPVQHVRVHVQMLGLALRRRLPREIVGQTFRLIVAGPGSLTGRYPEGNTGRADVSAFEPMPVPDDLRAVLDPHLN